MRCFSYIKMECINGFCFLYNVIVNKCDIIKVLFYFFKVIGGIMYSCVISCDFFKGMMKFK